jgi:aminopeptidase N
MPRATAVSVLLSALWPPTAAVATPEVPTLRLPADARPTLCELELVVVPTEAAFAGEIRIHLELPAPTSFLWLNATGLTVERASVSAAGRTSPARTVPGNEDFLGFAFPSPVGPGPAVLAVSYRGPIDDVRSRGLYRVREGDGEWYAYTFFEPIDARRVMPCFDEPAFKVPWRLRLRVREGDVALANAPVESERRVGGGMKLVSFAESRPLPSYLVAFVAGPFDVVDSGVAGRHGTPLRFVLPRGRREELRYARQVTPRAVELLEDFFAMPYPFGKLDVAVVPRFWGTMEHPGLVAMGQSLTLIKPAEETVSRRRRYVNILVHELAHYWFGDYVTLAWWDDTWLNEALATWLDAKVTDSLDPSWRFAEWSRHYVAFAMQTDALATARRIRQPVQSRSDIESSFDNSTTYFKGAAVISMFERWLGEEVMRSAVRGHLAAHAWGNATFDDFASALDTAAAREVSRSFATFLDQPGLPLVSASLNCTGARPRLRLRQERFLSLDSSVAERPTWRVPVCLRWPAGGSTQQQCQILDSEEQDVELRAPGCPEWVMAGDGSARYLRAAYDDRLRRGLAAEAAKGRASALSPIDRVALLDDLEALVRAGRLPLGAALDSLPSALHDPDPLVVHQALDVLGLLRPERLPADLRPNYARLVSLLLGPKAAALGWDPGNDPPDMRQLRERLVPHVATYGEEAALRVEARRRALAWLDDRRTLDPDLTSRVLDVAALQGDRSLYERLLAEARRTSDRDEQRKLLLALGSFRDPALGAEALALLLRDDFDLRESLSILWAAADHRETQDVAWRFVQDNFDRLAARARSDEAAWLVGGIVSGFCDAERRREAAAFFEPRVARIDGASLALANALETVDACVAEEARNASAVAEFLRSY